MSTEAMKEALEALEWLIVAFKPGSQGRVVAEQAINSLRSALGPNPLVYEVLDTDGTVIYNSETINEEDNR
jgi:hypothetical protein